MKHSPAFIFSLDAQHTNYLIFLLKMFPKNEVLFSTLEKIA